MNLLEELLPKLKPYVLGWISDVQNSSIGAHDLGGKLHTGTILDSQATQFLKTDGSRQLIGNLTVANGITIDGVDISAHAGDAAAHHAPVTKLDTTTLALSLSGQQISGSVIASSDVSAAAAEWVLKCDASGGLKLKTLEVAGDFTVGANVLNVDSNRVGINCVPDAQFDLDVAGNLRAQGWIIGKHAIQLSGARMICHFDGPEPHQSNFTGNPTGHMGQVASVSGGVYYRSGKFGKGLVVRGTTSANLSLNPSAETNITGWLRYQAAGYSVLSSISRSTVMAASGSYSVFLDAGDTTTIVFQQLAVSATGTYTFSMMAKKADRTAFVSGDYGNMEVMAGVTGGTSSATITRTETPDGWTRFSGTVTLTSTGTGNCGLYFNSQAGDIFIDCVLLENKGYASPYFDGSYTGATWSGTAHASTSTQTVGDITYNSNVIDVNKGSISFWIQMRQLEAGGSGGGIFDASSAWSGTNHFGCWFYNTGQLNLRIGDKTVSTPTYLTHGEIYHVAVTWKLGEYHTIYVNGVATIGATTYDAVPTLGAGLHLGHLYSIGASSWQLDTWIDDLIILDRVLSAAEVRAIYESNAPIFAETSTWAWRTPNNLAWADANGLFAVDSAANHAFGVIGVDGYSWGGFANDKGDAVFGRNVAGSAAMRWDQSAGKFGFYGGGSATVQVEIGTDGSLLAGAGNVKLNVDGLMIVPSGGSEFNYNSIRWANGSYVSNAIIGFATAGGNELILRSTNTSYSGGGTHGHINLEAWANYATPYSFTSLYVDPTFGISVVKSGAAGGNLSVDGYVRIVDGVTAPGTASGYAILYIDSADGDLKIKFGNGFVRTIAADS
jgi:hypothetical protein